MKVQVKEFSGGTCGRKISGEVVLWTSSVENFNGVSMCVPCVLVNDGKEVVVWSLKRELCESTVEILQ